MKNIARRLLQGLRQIYLSMRTPFQGIYPRWQDVPRRGAAFDDVAWSQAALAYARCMIERDTGSIPYEVTDEKALLPLLIALHPQSSVLDWGGAAGFGYLAVSHATGLTPRYVVVETAAVCDAARAFLPDVTFTTEIPEGRFDVVVLGSALQYVENWAALIGRLLELDPQFVLFTKTPAADVPTYITAQINMAGKSHPHWVWNASELTSYMETLGWRAVFRSACIGVVNQDNFPPSHRLVQPANLLFRRI
jgi:putative methyltransferase (TIGR04325 family)